MNKKALRRQWEDIGTTEENECYMTISGSFRVFVYDKGINYGWGWDLAKGAQNMQRSSRTYGSRATAQRAALRALSDHEGAR